MDNYETRLYALAIRAPITDVHISEVEYPITWNETIPATSINWWICGGVLVNIILLILILCI